VLAADVENESWHGVPVLLLVNDLTMLIVVLVYSYELDCAVD
jgi:hypothetical protein